MGAKESIAPADAGIGIAQATFPTGVQADENATDRSALR
jgi:hypothetical protein